MKRIVLLFAALLSFIASQATSIYELKYEFGKPAVVYTAFLVRYDNQTGFMRVRYSSGGTASVVEMQFTEQQGTMVSKGITYKTLCFQGKNPRNILGNKAYRPDFIWFRSGPQDPQYKLWGVTSLNTDGTTNQGRLTSIRTLNTSNITKAYANRFFGVSDPFYINLFKSPDAVHASGRLKLLVIANTVDPYIGQACERDAYRVKHAFADIADLLGMPFDYTELSGSNFTRYQAASTLAGTATNKEDVLVVVYTGHGFRPNTSSDAYPEFDFRVRNIQLPGEHSYSLKDVQAAMIGKSAHLKILLADCGNAELGVSKAVGGPRAATARSRVQWDPSNCKKLFLDANGFVVCTAASKGEVAYCDSEMGGYFLYNFLESLDKALSVFQSGPNWQSVFNETRHAVSTLAVEASCNRNVCTQTPVNNIQINQTL